MKTHHDPHKEKSSIETEMLSIMEHITYCVLVVEDSDLVTLPLPNVTIMKENL